MKTRIVLFALLALTLAGCGEALVNGGVSPPAAGSDEPTTTGPDEPVSNTPGEDPAPVPEPRPVVPRPGMVGVRAIGWEDADLAPDDRTVTIGFWSGVEPCYVLDRVEVAYEAKRVVVTLYQGSDPAEPDTACIELAEYKTTVVELSEPVAGRKLTHGAR